MFELATLGLLQTEPLHGYRLKQQLEMFMSGCISANYGTIYPLLKRLEEQGAVSVRLEEDGVKSLNRKIYSITQEGHKLWKQKMLEHPQESWVHARSRFMIKFFFFSHLEPEERLKLLEHRLMVCRLRQDRQEMQLFSADHYQVAAWSRFDMFLKDEIYWLEEQLSKEQSWSSVMLTSRLLI